MSPLRQQAILLLLGVIALTLALIVVVLNKSLDSDLLAVIGIVGAVAIVVNSLPTDKN